MLFIPYLLIIFSLAGIGFIVFKKIPLLVKLPAEPEAVLPRQSLKEKLFNQLKEVSRLNYWLIFLNWAEKTLKKIRILFLKLDNLVILLIAKLREISHNFTIKSKATTAEMPVWRWSSTFMDQTYRNMRSQTLREPMSHGAQIPKI